MFSNSTARGGAILVFIVAVLYVLIGEPLVAHGQYLFEKAPFTATIELDGVRYRFWMDAAGTNRNNSRLASWYDTQKEYRQKTFYPSSWDAYEAELFSRELNVNGPQNAVPLRDYIFLNFNAEVEGEIPISGGPSWRRSADDSTLVSLRDGRVLIAKGETPLHSAAGYKIGNSQQVYAGETTDQEKRRFRLSRKLCGQELLTREGLAEKARIDPKRYSDKPEVNTFLLPVRTSRPGDKNFEPHDFEPKDIVAVRLKFKGQWIDLQRRESDVSINTGSR
jgi:hypothetical protein